MNEQIERMIREREGFEHDDIPMSAYVEPRRFRGYRHGKVFPWLYVLICLGIFGAGFVLGYGTTWDLMEPGFAWSLCR